MLPNFYLYIEQYSHNPARYADKYCKIKNVDSRNQRFWSFHDNYDGWKPVYCREMKQKCRYFLVLSYKQEINAQPEYIFYTYAYVIFT